MSLDKPQTAPLEASDAGSTSTVVEQLMTNVQRWKSQFLTAKKSTQYAVVGVAALLLITLFFVGGESAGNSGGDVTFEVRRGRLDITVLEGGSLEALVSQEIRSQVKGREGVKILNIVEEGYRVTPEDVAAGTVLVQLDTAQLIDQQLNQEIAVETAEASYIERKAQFEIQLNENITALNDARQSMRFSRLDFEKFLGANVVNELIAELEIEERLAAAEEADRVRLAMDAPVSQATVQEVAADRGPARRAFDPDDIDSMPARMQERMRQLMAENGGELPPEVLERMRAGGGFAGGGRRGRVGDTGTDRSQGGFSGNGRDRQPGANGVVSESQTVPLETGIAAGREIEVLELQPLESETQLDTTTTLLMNDSYMAVRNEIDFTRYADFDALEDGEAKQQLRSLQDAVQEAQEEFLLAQDRIEGQRRLEARGFITPTELEAEELNLSKANNKLAEKETSLRLYIQYTFPKDAEQRLSDYENAVMGYQRQVKENLAEQAQEEARYKSAERKYNLEQVKLADINNQIRFATIIAERPGLVVYGAADQNSTRYRGGSSQEAIQEGATVRERQPILTIPDMREMAVKVNIHESAVQRVASGQQVIVSVDAFPEVELTGEVSKVAIVADSANSFMNPDLKVYPTVVKIHGTHDWLRPGMSAEVEILVNSLEDVVYVPLQAVTYWNDTQVVYVTDGGRPQRREIEVGTFSEQFIEVRSGIEPGEHVMLLPPQQGLADQDDV